MKDGGMEMYLTALCRAKRKDNGEWAVGYYCMAKNRERNKKHHYIMAQSPEDGKMRRLEVRPKTLCRCTGLYDRNRRLIFEHDAVRRMIWGTAVIGEVIWRDIGQTGFALKVRTEETEGYIKSDIYPIGRGQYDDDQRNTSHDEILGKVIDRPELLPAGRT